VGPDDRRGWRRRRWRSRPGARDGSPAGRRRGGWGRRRGGGRPAHRRLPQRWWRRGQGWSRRPVPLGQGRDLGFEVGRQVGGNGSRGDEELERTTPGVDGQNGRRGAVGESGRGAEPGNGDARPGGGARLATPRDDHGHPPGVHDQGQAPDGGGPVGRRPGHHDIIESKVLGVGHWRHCHISVPAPAPPHRGGSASHDRVVISFGTPGTRPEPGLIVYDNYQPWTGTNCTSSMSS
jgi:hypothetical protein